MIRMLILGYAFGLRSERLLCREVRVNLAFRWFFGLSIEVISKILRRVELANEQRRIANKLCSDKSPILKKERGECKKEESSSSRVVKGRPVYFKGDGQGQTGRCENRQGFEANRWRNAGDGRKAPRVFEYEGVKY